MGVGVGGIGVGVLVGVAVGGRGVNVAVGTGVSVAFGAKLPHPVSKMTPTKPITIDLIAFFIFVPISIIDKLFH